MPSFSFSPVKKKTTIKTNSSKYSILFKDIIGVVCITLEAKYYILVDKDSYDILPECYSCKGHKNLYLQNNNERQRILYIRRDKLNTDTITKHWLPFAPGCMVKGNIVQNNNTKRTYFKIKKVYIDLTNNTAHEAIEFYRNNIETISKIINNKLLENI